MNTAFHVWLFVLLIAAILIASWVDRDPRQ